MMFGTLADSPFMVILKSTREHRTQKYCVTCLLVYSFKEYRLVTMVERVKSQVQPLSDTVGWEGELPGFRYSSKMPTVDQAIFNEDAHLHVVPFYFPLNSGFVHFINSFSSPSDQTHTF